MDNEWHPTCMILSFTKASSLNVFIGDMTESTIGIVIILR